MDVVGDGEEVVGACRVDEQRLVAALKEVAKGFVAQVVASGVGGIEILHAFDEGGAVGFDEQVVVVAHKYKTVNGPAGAFGGVTERG